MFKRSYAESFADARTSYEHASNAASKYENYSDTDSERCDSSRSACSVTQSEQVHANSPRKRRRGVIEKRRRDRINNSLSELRRLVPMAYDKSSSAKLEKAEILQYTVDYLKMLNGAKPISSSGSAPPTTHPTAPGSFDVFGAYDAQRCVLDYSTIGFRECAGEVSRYLSSAEGLDPQDPLRTRLMSHLQMFATQKELQMAAYQKSNPYSNSVPSSADYGVVARDYYGSPVGKNPTLLSSSSSLESSPETAFSHYNSSSSTPSSASMDTTSSPYLPSPPPAGHAGYHHPTSAGLSTRLQLSATASAAVYSPPTTMHYPATGAPQIASVGTFPPTPTSATNSAGYGLHHGSQGKPHRPWGTVPQMSAY